MLPPVSNDVMGFIVDADSLPDRFPTHRHQPAFWESLGRAVATFGFLEEVLGKVIFALTATREYAPADVDQAYAKWIPQLERALVEPLGALIGMYDKAARGHGRATFDGLDDLIADLSNASDMRNILCHASWRMPDDSGRSLPLFVNREKMVVNTAFDVAAIDQIQQHATMLATAVMNSVTAMGWRFPGSSGPGTPVWEANSSVG